MKHLLAALVTLLAVLPREQDLVLGSTSNCPRRYLRRINGKCYYFSVKKLNWFGALNNCLRKGLTLADLSNPRDFDGAIGFLSSLGNTEDFWFGGNDLYHEGRFQYISNGRLVRYYSNFSNVLPAEHSDCDDCLEVRIRAHLNMVASDNCLEQQYFICSERYCQEADQSKKPKHHSHEHLHHFHHDIGESGDGEAEDEEENKPIREMLPITSASEENPGDSEAAIGAADFPDIKPQGPEPNGSSTVPPGSTEASTAAVSGATTPAGELASDAPTAAAAAADAPAADKPAADKPPTDAPAADKPATDAPAADKPPTDAPAAGAVPA